MRANIYWITYNCFKFEFKNSKLTTFIKRFCLHLIYDVTQLNTITF